MQLKLGLPKGSLQESTFNIFKKAGFSIKTDNRSYYPSVDDTELCITLVRAQEMARYVAEGIFDAGLTGIDWVEESGEKVKIVDKLIYSKQGLRPVRWVLAVPENSGIKSVKDLQGKKIATEIVNTVKKYLKKNKVRAKVEFSWGATEAKPPYLADAIVELTETGNSLRANNLKIIGTVLESTTVLIANDKSWKNDWKRTKINNLLMLLKGALNAEEKVGLKMNVEKKNLTKILAVLPALKKPTVSYLLNTNEQWLAVEVIIDERKVREIVPRLKTAGAEGIVEYALNKVIY
ncbi:MAG TPA: ATP phosphoribosyltransferase [Candidatus Goldiibacteriota bacterium]|nr:ATP phosphoribosyltransferase [Candidatus Goldiibacteriota bacterium]